MSCHHTSLQLKRRNLVERDCQRVHESRALGVATTSTEDGDQRRRVHFSSFSIAQRAVCHSCKVLQSTMKRTKESDMDGQAKLFSFGFSRGRSGNQPEPNPSSSGSSEQIRKPSSSKESTSSQLEQRSRSQSLTAPSSIPGFDNGCSLCC